VGSNYIVLYKAQRRLVSYQIISELQFKKYVEIAIVQHSVNSIFISVQEKNGSAKSK